MQQFATTPLNISQVWASGLKLARERFFALYPLFILNQILLTLSGYYFGQPQTSLVHMFQLHPVSTLGFIIASGIFTLIIYAIGFFILGTLMQGKPYTFIESLQATFHKLPALILASILALLATVAGFAILIIPGVFIGIAIFFYLPSIILDNMSPLAAFKHTFTLIWGNWWRSFFIIVAPIFAGLFINWLFTFVVVLISSYVQSGNAEIKTANYIIDIFSIFLQGYVDLLVLALQLIQWNNLKVHKQLAPVVAAG